MAAVTMATTEVITRHITMDITIIRITMDIIRIIMGETDIITAEIRIITGEKL